MDINKSSKTKQAAALNDLIGSVETVFLFFLFFFKKGKNLFR
jgi:hypothetical protein